MASECVWTWSEILRTNPATNEVLLGTTEGSSSNRGCEMRVKVRKRRTVERDPITHIHNKRGRSEGLRFRLRNRCVRCRPRTPSFLQVFIKQLRRQRWYRVQGSLYWSVQSWSSRWWTVNTSADGLCGGTNEGGICSRGHKPGPKPKAHSFGDRAPALKAS